MFIMVLFAYCSLWCQTPENSALTLEQCISIALQQNPLILSSLGQYQASQARISQAKALPQPSIYYDSDLQPKFFNFKDSGESYFGLTQSIEFPGKRHLRGKIASKESSEIMADIDLLKLDIVFEVKRAFYGLLLTQEKLKYAQQDLELAQDFLKKAELKLRAGDVAKVEVLRASVEASKAANEVKSAENGVRLAKAMLNFLLARKKYTPLEIKGKLKRPSTSLNFDELIKRALSFRPEIKGINFSLERETLVKKKAYLSYLPDFDLGVGEIAEAKANIESLKKEVEHLKNAITLEVEEAYMNALTADNQIQLFEDEMLNQAEEVYKMFLLSYQEGEIDGIELIEARRTLLETRKSYSDALYNYDLALTALEKSIGQSLEGEK